jgi:hypothetical protein
MVSPHHKDSQTSTTIIQTVFVNAEVLNCPASGQSSTGIKIMQSGTGMRMCEK